MGYGGIFVDDGFDVGNEEFGLNLFENGSDIFVCYNFVFGDYSFVRGNYVVFMCVDGRGGFVDVCDLFVVFIFFGMGLFNIDRFVGFMVGVGIDINGVDGDGDVGIICVIDELCFSYFGVGVGSVYVN